MPNEEHMTYDFFVKCSYDFSTGKLCFQLNGMETIVRTLSLT
jgi:hypothetical protein